MSRQAQSGHCPARFLINPPAATGLPLVSALGLISALPPLTYLSRTPAIASAQERMAWPLSQAIDGHLIPFNCLVMDSTSTPALNATETSLPIASSWADAQPPVLPRVQKTSYNDPCSSVFTVT